MAPFYKIMVEELQVPLDQSFYNQMVAKNEEELKRLDEKAKNAEQNEGETEVNEALLAKADYYAKIGDKVYVISIFLFFFLSFCICRKARLLPMILC